MIEKGSARLSSMRCIFPVLFIAMLVISLPAECSSLYDHGAEQMARFVETRPETAEILDEGEEIVEFLRKSFAGAYTSVPLVWDPEEPQGNAYAENTPNKEKTAIVVRVSSALSALDQVAALVYECLNARNEVSFAELSRNAYLGNLEKEDFIAGILRLEHRSLKDARAFLASQRPFRNVDIPETEFYRKMVGTPEEFDPFLVYLRRIKRPDFDIFSVYSRFYDYVIMSPQRRRAMQDALSELEPAGAANGKGGAPTEAPPQ